MTEPSPPVLQLAFCAACGSFSFPANIYACRRCGAPRERLEARDLPAAARLRNAITLHAALHPDLPVPCVVGEVELAPGVVEEALLDIPDESAAVLGMALRPVAEQLENGAVRWRFAPQAGEKQP